MRIITGTAKGCNLKTPKGMSTRPTSDRVKESLFSILGGEVEGTRVLDIFAGTGALGLEALSRGAREAVFIDMATDKVIRENAQHCRLSDRAESLKGDVLAQLNRLSVQGRRFDLVFCDPPYHEGLWQKAISWLDDNELLAPRALVVLERGGENEPLPELKRLKLLKNQRYGNTTQIDFLELPELMKEEVEP